MGADISSISGLVGAEACRNRCASGSPRTACRVLQMYASADIGNIAYETRSGASSMPAWCSTKT
jgi:hypothetical protein